MIKLNFFTDTLQIRPRSQNINKNLIVGALFNLTLLCTLIFYRVKIVEITQRDMETNRIVEVQVYFIDRGFYENVPSANLFEIAPQFVDLPYQVSSLFISSL